jgi:protocatechuate 3,4-dioxygenase beta subunit
MSAISILRDMASWRSRKVRYYAGADGKVRFATIYPGWYPGRTPHIHFKVFIDKSNVITGQLYFPEPITEQVYATALPYRERKEKRDTFNADDFIFVRQGGPDTILNLTEKDSSSHASLIIGVERNR